MQESGPRGTAPHEQHPGSPGPRREPDGSGPVRLAAVAGVCTVLSSFLVAGGAWATAAGVLAAVAGVVVGIVALVRSRRATSRGVVTALAVLAIVWGSLNAVGGGTRLLVWPATEAYQQCTANALTLSSTQRCQQQLTDNVWHHLSGTPLETGFPESGSSTTSEPTATTPTSGASTGHSSGDSSATADPSTSGGADATPSVSTPSPAARTASPGATPAPSASTASPRG